MLGMVDDGSGNLRFNAEFIEDLSLGNTPAPKGHFIIDPFSIAYEALRTGTGGSGGFGGSAGPASNLDTGSTTIDPDWWTVHNDYTETP